MAGPTGGTISILSSNPNRIGLIFRVATQASLCFVSLRETGGAGTFATYLVDNNSPWDITHKEFPGLPQEEWFANLNATSDLSIIETILTAWPQEKDN